MVSPDMPASGPKKSRRISPFAVIIGGFLVLWSFAAVYLGLADPLHWWPYERS